MNFCYLFDKKYMKFGRHDFLNYALKNLVLLDFSIYMSLDLFGVYFMSVWS